MSKQLLALLGVVVVGAGLTWAEEPPYKRLLQGDDAKKAAALTKCIDELWAAAKFAEALAPAEEELVLRRRVQGEGHWQVADAARRVETLRQAARLPANQQKTLAEVMPTNELAAKLYAQQQYAQAELLFRKALAAREQLLGPKHPDTATSYLELAGTLDAEGRAKDAEPLYRKALAIRQEVLGPDHPDTALSYHNLAYVLHVQGRYKEAEQNSRKALAIREQVLGPNHPDTASTYNDLAVALQSQGRADDAEPLLRKALAIKKEVLGSKHRDTALSYNNLATNLQEQGRAKEAEPLLRQALAIHEEVLGATHPVTATSYNNLAVNLDAQGRVKDAEPLLRKALAIKQEALGAKHPDTALSVNNLAANLQAQGRAREAEPLLRQALAIWEQLLGAKHPYTATSYNNLAANLQEQGRAKDAEALLRQALAIREAVLGGKHHDTAASYNNLALNLQAQSRAKEAEALLRKALAIWEDALGARHPTTAQCYHNLASNLDAQGRAPEGEPLYRKALAIHEEAMGAKHPHTAASYNNLAYNLDAQGRAKDAEPLYRKALAIRQEVLGPDHPNTAESYNNLAHNLQGQGRAREAEPYWRKGARGVEAARLRLAATSLDRAQAVQIRPHFGLAACRARLSRPADAWAAAESGLARGLLDDLAARAVPVADADAQRRDGERAARLAALDRLLTPLLTREKLSDKERRRRAELLDERARLDAETADVAAERSRRAVLPLAEVQAALAPNEALVLWVDVPHTDDHWGCVVRHTGAPAWVRLQGSGPEGAWTEADDKLPRRLRDDLAHGEPDAGQLARRLAGQRIKPLEPHLGATEVLPAVRHLVVVPVGAMADVPIEVLADRYLISYAPSGTVFAGLRHKHRPLQAPTLLALGDPSFRLPAAGPHPAPPDYGLYLALVLPGGNAARHGLRSGDVLLSYAGTKLLTTASLKVAEGGDSIPVQVWRDGTTEMYRLGPGKLGVAISADPPALALRKRRESQQLADARRSGEGLKPLPGTRLEVATVAALLPQGRATLLVGCDASEQRLDELAASGRLKDFRLLHLATHGSVDLLSAAHSALELARDRLPGPEEQARLAAAGKKVLTGQLSVATIAESWELDADLVVLSACETALGPEGGGEGLLGFSQVLLGKGARSLVLSLWKVDDTATALLMARFYQNLLGKREGLDKPLPKAEALQEAKRWLRTLPRGEVEHLAGQLAQGAVRAKEEPKGAEATNESAKPSLPAGETPFAHPFYWAAFILIGDPE